MKKIVSNGSVSIGSLNPASTKARSAQPKSPFAKYSLTLCNSLGVCVLLHFTSSKNRRHSLALDIEMPIFASDVFVPQTLQNDASTAISAQHCLHRVAVDTGTDFPHLDQNRALESSG